ncbi:MAG TPA: hypothetical protein VGI99_03415 [Gemmataceae bacterium]
MRDRVKFRRERGAKKCATKVSGENYAKEQFLGGTGFQPVQVKHTGWKPVPPSSRAFS